MHTELPTLWATKHSINSPNRYFWSKIACLCKVTATYIVERSFQLLLNFHCVEYYYSGGGLAPPPPVELLGGWDPRSPRFLRPWIVLIFPGTTKGPYTTVYYIHIQHICMSKIYRGPYTVCVCSLKFQSGLPFYNVLFVLVQNIYIRWCWSSFFITLHVLFYTRCNFFTLFFTLFKNSNLDPQPPEMPSLLPRMLRFLPMWSPFF